MNVQEYNHCVDEFSDNIYRFLLKNIKDKDKAKDIVQDTFEKLWINVDNVNYSKAKSYLFTTAYHAMIDMIRREKKSVMYEPENHDFQTHTSEYLGLKDILNEALSKLSEIQRSVLLLRDYEGYPYEEIGEITNLTESQVKVYIYRARMFVKQYIGSLERVM